MNAIHIPGLPAEAVVGTGLSPEQRVVAGPLDAATVEVAQLDAVPGLTASVTIDVGLDVGLDGGVHGGVDSSHDDSVDSSAAGTAEGSSLRRAVEQAIDAHEMLRTAFGPVDGYRGLRQWPLPVRPALDWSSVDLRGGDEAALQAWIDQLSTPLAITQGQVLRAGVARVSDTRIVLALRASALVADEGSLRALLAQIAQAHVDRTATTVGFDTEEIFQYGQYVEWRAELASGDEARTGAAYWRAHLAEDTAWNGPRLPLPLAPRAGRVEARTVLDVDLARRIDSAEVGAERLLHGVWLLLLARLNGFERFLAGWRHDCRDDYEVMRGAVGVFEKLLPVAVTLSGETRVDEWLARVAATTGAHVDAQEYWTAESTTLTATPTTASASASASTTGTPTTAAHRETVFHWLSLAAPASGWSAPAIVRSGVDRPDERAALVLAVHWGDAAELVLHADGLRHSQQAVERLLGQFTTLIAQVLDRPQAAVRELDPVGPLERAALLRAAQGERRNAGALTVSQHVAEWAALSPQAPALEAGGVVLDYRTLNQRANRLARAMTSLGVTPGSLVALNLPRGTDLIVAMLAAWRAGAAYLPLEPGWPVARRRALLADARPALMLSGSPPHDGDDGDEAASALLTGDVITPAGQPAIDLRQLDGTLPATQPRLGDLAYVLYTSGSTGQPKGVAIEHGQLLNYVVAATVAMDLAGSRRWGLTSSVVADLGNTALFGALFNGACLVVANDDDTRSPAAFARFIETLRIDAVKIVPSHLEALLEGEAPRVPRTLVLGGEAAPRALIDRLRRLAPDTAIHNHYGPTETTVGVLVHRVRASDLQGGDALPLTQPLANNRVLVLDEAMRLVPAGAVGQVFVGGPQVCRGYLGREVPGAFVDDPFHPGERLYRTGDVARVLAEGGLRLAGRADHQVKVRGFRVDPAEIEVALLALPGVRQAVVLAEPGATGEIELSACVVLESAGGSATAVTGATGVTGVTGVTGGAGADTATDRRSQPDSPDRATQPEHVERIRESLKAALPSHMVPTRFHAFDDFPRLANGKLDRRAIVARIAAEAATAVAASAASANSASGGIADASRAPRDALEVVLAQGMGLLLGRGPIGIDEDFFELGGHSLMVIRLVARLRKLLGIEIEPGLVFDHPTVAELAAALRAGPWDTSGFERLAATDWQKAEKTSETTADKTAAPL